MLSWLYYFYLQLAAVAQVAGIAESRHDVFVLVHARVNGCAPYCGLVVGQSLLYVVYAVGCGYHAGYVYALRRAFGKEGLVAQLHRSACCQHGVGYDERLAVDARRGKIFNMYAHLGALVVGIFAVCAHKGVSGVVEHVEESVVERQSGAEYRGKDNLVGRHADARYAQGRGYVFRLIFERLAYLVGHHLAHARYVVAEQQAVLLIVYVSYLCQILV